MTAEMLDQTETQQSNKHTSHLSPQLLKRFEDWTFSLCHVHLGLLHSTNMLQTQGAHYYYQAREALICHSFVALLFAPL